MGCSNGYCELFKAEYADGLSLDRKSLITSLILVLCLAKGLRSSRLFAMQRCTVFLPFFYILNSGIVITISHCSTTGYLPF